MQYLGGKSRIAKAIADEIRLRRADRTRYIEPFLGAGSVAIQVAAEFNEVIVADIVPDLVLLWEAAIAGWVPPTELSEDEWRALRRAEPSALRGFAGFSCSFGGKWFDGYARDRKGRRNFAATGSRSIVKRGQALRGAEIRLADYRALDALVDEFTVVYADPPYAGTRGYAAAGPFDSEAFWGVMRKWAERGALVLVSEYEAPAGWVVAWEGFPVTTIAGRGAVSRVRERLYIYHEA